MLKIATEGTHVAKDSAKSVPYPYGLGEVLCCFLKGDLLDLLLNTTFRLHKVRVRTTGFGATFAAVVVFVYQLREFSFSAVANHFELRCQLKQLLLMHCKVLFGIYISYLNLFRRVALRQKPFFKGPSGKNLHTIYS